MFDVRCLISAVLASCLVTVGAGAQAPVTITIRAETTGIVVPGDFLGLSFETSNLLPDRNGHHLFSPTNQPLIHLFRTIGIKSLRIGGGTAELPNYAVPGPADIDQLFAFAEAADVQVIYTLRLLNGDKTATARLAKYIADGYPSRLVCFCLGNEPDWHAYHSYPGKAADPAIFETTPGVPGSAYASYLAKWNAFANAIANAVPKVHFGGPDTGSNYPVPGAKDTEYNGVSWTEQFIEDKHDAHRLVGAFLHDYVGQSAEGLSAPTAIDAMLSQNWPETHYQALFDHVLARVQHRQMTYRFTECNDYTGGVEGASNGYASALWALDYLHWHASRGCAGVNFHNKRWIRTCTIYQAADSSFRINPKAYGLKAFAMGSHGVVEGVTLDNPGAINFTAYAVRARENHFLTVINKEHGPNARDAKVALVLERATNGLDIMFLEASDKSPSSKTGVTLGGGTISATGDWVGQWQPVQSVHGGNCLVNVPVLSAAIIRIPSQ